MSIQKILLLTSTLFLFFNGGFSQDRIINLYPENPPLSTGIKSQESWENGRVSNVQIPQLYVFMADPAKSIGVAVVYCPGGGYTRLAMKDYGKGYADYFNDMGITFIGLKYRLPISDDLTEPFEVPFADAARAMKLVRSMAQELRINPDSIGIIGGSAGGHLASMVSVHFDDSKSFIGDDIDALSCKPAFSVLIYPVISMDAAIVHMGSRRNLLGKDPSEEKLKYYSSELQVTADTPPTFLVHGANDSSVSVNNSLRYYEALLNAGVSVEMHLFRDGPHGSGLGKPEMPWSEWKVLCRRWLEDYILSKD